MGFSATRLTCFALLSAIEQDMRETIAGLFGDRPLQDVVVSADRIEQAQLRRGKDGLQPSTSLPSLLPYLDFGDSIEILLTHSRDLSVELLASLAKVKPRIARVIAIRNRVAHTRPMEIDDSAQLLDLADELISNAPNDWPTLVETVDHLRSDPSYVLGLTINLVSDPDKSPQHNLPVPDFDETGFFGRQDELRRIKKAIKGAYPVVSVLGDGGIGKTAIALKAAYELLEDSTRPFEAIVWVTAKATILTPNEIRRINGAIESSLGLFASAAGELGAHDADDPVAEVLSYMETFKILLVLDNLETVLDTRLRDFLLNLPLGSKVIVTSRIGLGVENPVQLTPFSEDDSARFLRALARIRNIPTLQSLNQEDVLNLVRRMAGHPAYIKWFVAGVQAGRRPEDLVGNNELLLDFCMSNVYEYLSEDARAALRSMQVLPGARNQGELAYLNDFPAAVIQSALLELLTTNFIQMSAQSAGDSLDTIYQLSEFSTQYLGKHHPVAPDERDWLLDRSQQLRDLGFQMTIESVSSPYSADTVYVRGPGDVHGAGILREALQMAENDPSGALARCHEVQVLAPGYYEAWRVEAFVRASTHDHAGAAAAFERAYELAPESAVLLYHYGSFLLDDAGSPHEALGLLQRAAHYDPESPALAGQIAWAHYCLGNAQDALTAASHILTMPESTVLQRRGACLVGLRAAISGVDATYPDSSLELVEAAVDLAESANSQFLKGESFDRILQLRSIARSIADRADGYITKSAERCAARLLEVQLTVLQDARLRGIGTVKNMVADKGYGFLTDGTTDYFLHFRDLLDRHDWEGLAEGLACAFDPNSGHPRGPRAERVRLLK